VTQNVVKVVSDRVVKYNDPRAATGGRPPFDVICNENYGSHLGRVMSSGNEKIPGHPNQLPERYLELIILINFYWILVVPRIHIE